MALIRHKFLRTEKAKSDKKEWGNGELSNDLFHFKSKERSQLLVLFIPLPLDNII